MSLKRLSYEIIADALVPQGSGAPASGATPTAVRVKSRAALALTLTAAAAIAGLVVLVILDPRSKASTAPGDAAEAAGWQDQQPLAGLTMTAFSQSLKAPEDRWSVDGELCTTLRVAPAVARAGPLAPALNVRAYEGAVPGPTLRVKPGDRLVVNLWNNLGLPEGAPPAVGDGGGGGDGARAGLEGKVEAWPNVTNIHVHGLHVSPSGIGDNIYRRAGPGDALEYIYDLPSDHYPGIFYYHPHFEGSSSVQTLGGMSGAIIVEDPEGSLPPEIEAMREVVMLLQETNIESGSLRNYKAASKIAGSNMPLYGDDRDGREEEKEGGADETEEAGEGEAEMLHFVTVNGQYQPVLGARPGEAFRLRVVHGGNNDHMNVSLEPAGAAHTPASTASEHGRADGEEGEDWEEEGSSSPGGSCTLLTLARDGVYLPAPRRQGGGNGRVVLSPGSRADLAVRCDREGVYRLTSSKGVRADGEGEEGEGETSIVAYLGQDTDVFEGTLAFVEVGGDAMDMDLPTDSPAGAVGANRLLQDLRDLPDEEVSRFVFEFNAAGKVSHLDQTYTWYGINGVQYSNSSRVMRRVPLGSVEEWVIVNQRKGRGEGADGCHPPPPPPPPQSGASTELEGRVDSGKGFASGGDEDAAEGGNGGGESNGHRHRRARRLGGPSERPGRGSGATENAELIGEEKGGPGLGDGGAARAACARAGPGEVTADGHPFHLHVNHFQVVSSSWGDEGPDWNVGDWRDTISIPAPGNVTVRWRADDFTGEAVAHCHIFGHSDTGMMMNFEIFEEL